MARRRKASFGETVVGIGALFVLALIATALAGIALILTSPFFWIVVTIAGLIFVGYRANEYFWEKIFPNRYFAGEEFLGLRARISEYVDECNELNDHIADLKAFQESIRSNSKNIGTLRDSSQYNFARRTWSERLSGAQVHNCSRAIVSNAQNDPFKYLCKYFSIKADERSLADFEGMLNDFSAAEEGADCLIEKRRELISSIIEEVHPQIKIRHWQRLEYELGFDEVVFDKISFPVYSFQYVSSGGYSSLSYDVEMDTDVIEEFVDYLSAKVKFSKSVAGQRALMTKALRDLIKERDDFQCQECGISAHDTKNLLLEIDHIKPLSKGGMTSEDNLQTLCWKCNRSKGAKDPT